jgi:hypothetical protein
MDLLEAIAGVISAADPQQRKLLAETFDRFVDDNPEDFAWMIGPQAPSCLKEIITEIDIATQYDDAGNPPRGRLLRLVDRKPGGGA